MTKAIFVSNRSSLGNAPGGVQWCTNDYLATLAAAGLQTQILPYDNDQRPLARLRRKFNPRPFVNRIRLELVSEIVTAVNTNDARWVFMNNAEPLVLAAAIKKEIGSRARLIFLSHGVESTDHLNELRLGSELVPSHRRQPVWIGRLFLGELEQRRHLDGVICLSEEDVLFERWLGSEQVCFLPRSVNPDPLKWQPAPGRVGTVSTLNHLPNLDGLRRLAAELDRHPTVRLRLVGGPQDQGEKLAREFRSIEYLGPLGEAGLKSEAATWCAFMNPIFCQARGASTKVATALGWGLPVLTSQQGARGYRWNDRALPRVQTARELAQLALLVANGSDHEGWRRKAGEISRLAPDLAESGEILGKFLSGLGS